MPNRIVITGASSGIGQALALEYAAAGIALGLIGRNKDRLDEVAERARAKGAAVTTAMIDVRDSEGMSAFLVAFDDEAPVDCVIASAGVTSVTRKSDKPEEDFLRSKDVFDINLGGVINAIAPLAPRMRQRRGGQIAVVSSIAAFAPLPDQAVYSASKAALVALVLAVRPLYLRDGVSVSAVCPGYVDTPMVASFTGLRPGQMTAERAARRIRQGLDRRKAIVAFPLTLYFGARVQQWLPAALRERIMLAFQARQKPGRSGQKQATERF
jgi:short-subunit dehydrogenase